MRSIRLSGIIILLYSMNIYPQHMKLVLNNKDTGEGSLRQVLSEAVRDDTIYFDYSLENDTIKLASEIQIDSTNLVFNINKIKVTISGQSTKRIFKIIIQNRDSIEFNNINFINGYNNIAGGVIYYSIDSGAYLRFNNCNFNNNIAATGGVVYAHCKATNLENGGEIRFNNCEFLNNTATGTSGVLHNESKVNIFFENCYFYNNKAHRGGVGQIQNVNFNGCRINNCYSSYYCSVLLTDNSTITNSGFFNNRSANAMMEVKSTIINNCIFAGNWSRELYQFILHEGLHINNSVFTDNLRNLDNLFGFFSPTARITNSIFYNNGTIYNVYEYYLKCAYDKYQSEAGNPIQLSDNPFNGTNNGMGNDSIWGTDDDDFSLNTNPKGGLLCINTGDKNYLPSELLTDYNGNPRVFDGQVDIGAVEYINHLSFIDESESEIKGEPLTIYPNPAERIFNIKVPDFNKIIEVKISIYNISGILVFNEYKVYEGNPIIIENKLLKGSYFVRVQGDGKIYNHKLIVL